MTLELRDRDLGQLLATILETATGQFGRLLLLQVVGTGPVFLTQLALDPGGALAGLNLGAPPEEIVPVLARFYGALLVVAVVSVLLYPIELAAAALLVEQLVEGRPPDLWACLKGAARAWPRTLLLTVTWNVAATIGLLLCYLPGLAIYTLFFASPAVVVLERQLPWMAAFQRSRELLRGHFLETLVVYLAVLYAPAMVLAPVLIGASLLPGAAGTIVGFVVGAALGTLPLVAHPIVYYHLRTVNEALDVERLTALVDAIGARQAQEEAARGAG